MFTRLLGTLGAAALAGLFLLAGPVRADPADGGWKKDLAAAREAARAEHKLVLCFLLLGELDAPDC